MINVVVQYLFTNEPAEGFTQLPLHLSKLDCMACLFAIGQCIVTKQLNYNTFTQSKLKIGVNSDYLLNILICNLQRYSS